MREGSIEKKVSSQVCGHRRELEQIFKKVKSISSTLRQAVLDHGSSRSRGRLMKDIQTHEMPRSGREWDTAAWPGRRITKEI